MGKSEDENKNVNGRGKKRWSSSCWWWIKKINKVETFIQNIGLLCSIIIIDKSIGILLFGEFLTVGWLVKGSKAKNEPTFCVSINA